MQAACSPHNGSGTPVPVERDRSRCFDTHHRLRTSPASATHLLTWAGVAGFEPAAASSRRQVAAWAASTAARVTCGRPSVRVRWRPPLPVAIVAQFATSQPLSFVPAELNHSGTAPGVSGGSGLTGAIHGTSGGLPGHSRPSRSALREVDDVDVERETVTLGCDGVLGPAGRPYPRQLGAGFPCCDVDLPGQAEFADDIGESL